MRPIAHEIEELQGKLLEMGGLVEAALRSSVRSLVLNDSSHAADVLNFEPRINDLQIQIDEAATCLLARHQPVARDLRFVTSALKINSDLERMGDLAVNIAERSISFLGHPEDAELFDVPRMSRSVEAMVRECLDSFVLRDEALARNVLASDDPVDRMKDGVYREVLNALERRTVSAAAAFDLMFVAHNLERIADNATNIAEDVLFLVSGSDVRHRHAAMSS
ncbi:MAG: phosphate signaling complex protein PhoU [Acidobacteriota bacterium]|nr:phosphate signaling complex protein PhoU [Acidobacteriota bacterium]